MILKNVLEGRTMHFVTTYPSAAVDEALNLIIDNNLCCLPVVDNGGKPVGIVSGLDILTAIHRSKGDFASLKVKDIMKAIAVVGKMDDDAASIMNIMEKQNIHHIPVVSNGNMVGFISLKNIYRTTMKQLEVEVHYLTGMLDKRDKSGDYDSFSKMDSSE